MRKIDLQLFAGGHSVTVVKDGHMTTASASSTSDVQKISDVTLTLTPASGYELDKIEVLSGGVTITKDDDTYGFKMGEADVVIVVYSKANNLYKITESVDTWVNDTKVQLTKNVKEVYTANGALADVECTPTALTVTPAIQSLIDAGIVIKV